MNKSQPLVAIHCLVYNHAPYLRDCFEGFVMQQTNFPFVAVVHDDASTDSSASIICEYERKYPHIFKPIYEVENQYSKGGFGRINEIMNAAIDATGAKYVALCEGDDYWTNPLKLQKQVDILEDKSSYTMCYTSYTNVDQYNNPINWENRKSNLKRSRTGDIFAELLKGNFVQTCTMLYRIDSCKQSTFLGKLDYEYALQTAIGGECVFLNETTANYRLQPNSAIHTMINQLRNITNEIWSRYVNMYTNQKVYRRTFLRHIKIMSIITARMISLARNTDQNEKKIVKTLLKTNRVLYFYMPFGFISRVCKVIQKQFQRML